MFRWLAVTLTLCVAAVLVGVLCAGRPVVDGTSDFVSPPRLYEGARQAPRDAVKALAAGPAAKVQEREEPLDPNLPISVVPLAIVPGCRLTASDYQEVPSRHDGEILFLGTEIQPAEVVPKYDLIEEEIGFLAIRLKPNETYSGHPIEIKVQELSDPKDSKDQKDGKGAPKDAKEPAVKWVKVDFRPFRDRDAIEPYTLVVHKETRQFRRLKPGTVVKEGQLLGWINPELALDEVSIAVAKLNASHAKWIASEETRKEAKVRMDRAIYLNSINALSAEERDGAILQHARYLAEEAENKQNVDTSRRELNKALTNLKLHEIRARIPGVVKAIYKNTRGEAVKGLEKGADVVLAIQNPARLRVDGKVDVEYAGKLEPGKEVVVEPIQRESYEQAFRGHRQDITGVAVSKDLLIVSASGDERVYVWDRRQLTRRELFHPGKTFAVCCTPPSAEANLCLTGGEDGIGRIWDLAKFKDKNVRATEVVQELRDGHHKPINCVAFGAGGKWCATGGDDSMICVWDVETGKRIQTLVGHRGRVTSLQFLSERQLLTAAGDRSLIVWDISAEGAPRIAMKQESRGGEVSQLGAHPNGKQVLFDKGKEIQILSVPDAQFTGSLQNSSGAMTFTTMALFSPDGKLILTNGAADGRLQIWRAPTSRTRGYELRRLIWTSPATCGAFAPDGSFVVTGSKDGLVLVWSLPPKEIIERQLTARIISVDSSLEDSTGVVVHAEMENPNNMLYIDDRATLVLYPGGK
jgi:WD40 repeat protein